MVIHNRIISQSHYIGFFLSNTLTAHFSPCLIALACTFRTTYNGDVDGALLLPETIRKGFWPSAGCEWKEMERALLLLPDPTLQ